MRLVPSSDTVPNAVNRYLLPHERQVIVVRLHPASMIAPGLALPGVLAAAARLARRAERPDVVWYASGLVAADCVRRLAGWPMTYFVLTNQRLLTIRGTLRRTVTAIPLDKVENLEFQRSVAGRVLGFGTIAPRDGRGRRMLPAVRYLPYPEQLYLELCSLLYPDPAGDERLDDR
jgi:hypothetical protein